jgi:hypothetical protein
METGFLDSNDFAISLNGCMKFAATAIFSDPAATAGDE